MSAARSGRSRMWPTLDSTTKSSPRYPAIVFALAGDSTITRRMGFPLPAMAGQDSAGAFERHLQPDRDRDLAAPLRGVPAAGPRSRESALRGRIRPRLQPRLELRSVAARDADLPSPLPPVHGEIRALLVAAQVRRGRRRRVSGAPRATGRT